jgi:hydrogenase 3 maturation protease
LRNPHLVNIEKYLKGNTAIVGVGNIIKGDDQVGPMLIQRLQGKTNVCLFDCGEVPENYIQPIVKIKPETIVIIDASDWGGLPGELRLIKEEEIENFSFSTHNTSLRIFVDYLKKELPLANIIIIGVQLGRRGFMLPLSHSVETTLNELVKFFMKSL